LTARETRNRRFLSDLFAGPFRGHGIIMDPEWIAYDWTQGDVAVSSKPVQDWMPLALRNYEAMVARHEALDDDSVPYVRIQTGTEVFAAAFGCSVHIYRDAPGSPLCALPLVTTAQEADRLEMPDLSARPLDRIFEFARLLREQVGPDVPIGGVDIQSPFDIAALVWRKQDLMVAMIEEPEAVKRLVAKCERLLELFLSEFKRQFPNCNLCHCPTAWAPPDLECWLSEDEAGSMSGAMFEQFCAPSLTGLSQAFGGLFIHCCADADHQYSRFARLPNLRGLNRVFQASGPRPAIEAFSQGTVLIVAWTGEAEAHRMLDLALPTTRFLFNMPAQPLEEAKATYARLRERCPRQ